MGKWAWDLRERVDPICGLQGRCGISGGLLSLHMHDAHNTNAQPRHFKIYGMNLDTWQPYVVRESHQQSVSSLLSSEPPFARAKLQDRNTTQGVADPPLAISPALFWSLALFLNTRACPWEWKPTGFGQPQRILRAYVTRWGDLMGINWRDNHAHWLRK